MLYRHSGHRYRKIRMHHDAPHARRSVCREDKSRTEEPFLPAVFLCLKASEVFQLHAEIITPSDVISHRLREATDSWTHSEN